MNAPEISIIGAGLSGLTCAYRLKQLGRKVMVYEALDRPGGRVLTHYEGGSHEELGGKFLNDGGDALHIRALIKELGLKVVAIDVPITGKYYRDGQALPIFALHETAPRPDEDAYVRLRRIADSSRDLGQVIDRFLEGHPVLRRIFEIRMRNYEGSPTRELSAHYFDLFWKFYIRSYESSLLEKQSLYGTYEVPTVEGGNSRLIAALCSRLEGSILYRMPLQKIFRKEGKLALQFENGEVRAAGIAIATVPLPLLKKISFDEELLPEARRQIFLRLPFGSNAKILIPIATTGPIVSEFSYTQEALIWFNRDYTLMTLYFGGDAAQFSSDPQSLKAIYRQELPALKEIHPQVIFPSDDKITGMGWSREPYFLGSYSNFGLGQYGLLHESTSVRGIAVKKGFEPLDDKVFFAGEGTSIDYPSTMEGAVESAERIAALAVKALPPHPLP